MTPLNNLNAINQKLEKQLDNLKKEHHKLVDESVITEKLKDEYEDAIASCCKDCAFKGNEQCDSCPLHNTAVRRELW